MPRREVFVLVRFWRLLDRTERRRLLAFGPLLVVSALIEVMGVAAVIPFLVVLTDPTAVADLPVVGPLLAGAASDRLALIRWSGLVFAGALLVANLLVLSTNWWMYRFNWGLNHAIASRLLRHYLTLPYDFFLVRNSASLINRIIDEVRQLTELGVRSALELITRSFVVLALVAFLVVLDPLTAAVAFAVLGAAYAAIYLVSRRYLQRIGRESATTGADRMKAVAQALGGLKDLRVAGREEAAYEAFLGPSRRYTDVQAAMMAIAGLPRYALEAVAVGGLVVVATLLAGRGGGTAGILPLLGAYAFAGLRLLPALQVLFGAVTRIRFASGVLAAIEADLAAPTAGEPEPRPGAEPVVFEHSIVLEGVTFAYQDADEPALRDLSVELVRQTTLAIVGRTGSGKSTLVDVLLGLLVPQSGRILVDGIAVTRLQLRSFRRLFGYVPQSVFLLDDTIAHNVAFGVPNDEIDLDAVRRACREAQIDEFIEEELPQGYATEVGERGVRFSGGQRQRIGIARALYHQPEILVFDEATSALDVHTEQRVFEALERIARHRTVVTIAHRLETVAKADHVIVLDDGRIVDRGAPEEVLARYKGTWPVAPME